MTNVNLSNGASELLRMEYEKLHDYYLWSLGTHSERLSLYVKLLSATLAACFAVSLSPLDQRHTVCGGLVAAFLVVGMLLLARVVASQVTNIWCVFSINILRKFIRDNFGLREVFRSIPLRCLRKKATLFGLLRYRLKSASLIIAGNSIAAAGLVGFWSIGHVTVTQLLVASAVAGIVAWLLQLWYYNRQLRPLHSYVVQDASQYEREVARIGELADGWSDEPTQVAEKSK